MPIRPRLTPAIADVRRAVRDALRASVVEPAAGAALTETSANATSASDSASHSAPGTQPVNAPLVLVALSGGADSLALAAATAFEAPRLGLHAGAVIIDHGLQPGSADVADVAAEQARALELDPVLVIPVEVPAAAPGEVTGGPEAAARTARYAGFERALSHTGASHILLGHTLDDQAETVLLGLARGSGPRSLQGMASATRPWLRPLLGIRRSQTEQFCEDSGLSVWHDPHNQQPRFGRVRVRQRILPMLEEELGPGVAEALARTAAQLREDAEVLDALAATSAATITRTAEGTGAERIQIDATALAALPAALRQRVIRMVVWNTFAVTLSRRHTLEVARLVTHWRGQGEVHLPRIRVVRADGWLNVSAAPPPQTEEPS